MGLAARKIQAPYETVPGARPLRQAPTARPREFSRHATLKLLSWFLRDNLPRLLPAYFSRPPQVALRSAIVTS